MHTGFPADAADIRTPGTNVVYGGRLYIHRIYIDFLTCYDLIIESTALIFVPMPSWKVIHLKPNTEKKFIRYCKLYGIICYLPMRKSFRTCQRRRITVELPVFTGYAFVKYAEKERLTVLKSNCVCRILEPHNPRRFIRELIMVRRALRIDPTLKPTRIFEEGQMVRIKSGPFTGTEGSVKRITGRTKVILNVSAIGQALKIEVPNDALEAL
ncbi:MAG: transcription termination/antitermination NusG family protein [Kiritimatiellia bacterium]